MRVLSIGFMENKEMMMMMMNSVLNILSRLFSKLPERIRMLETFRSFKKEVKILLFTKTFYSVDEFLHSNFS
jgi:hypothetical protein